MRMKKRRLPYTAICSCMLLMTSLTACEEIGGEDAITADNGNVVLEISVPRYSADWDVGTRALEPLDDQLQKMIHNLWYYFYNEEQNLTHVFHQNIVSTTVHRVKFEDFINAAAARGVTFDQHEGYLFIIANSENIDDELETDGMPMIVLNQSDRPTGDYDEWRRTIANVDGFKTSGLLPLYISGWADPDTPQPDYPHIGSPGHIMLSGAFHGVFCGDRSSEETGHTMSIVLGRAVARLRIALSGEGLGKQARITIQDAPIVTSLYPSWQPLFTNDMPSLDCWMDYMQMVSVNDGSIVEENGGRTSSTYYYCGENSTHDFPIKNPNGFGDVDENGIYTGKVSTTLIVETWDEYNADNKVTHDEANPTKDPVAVNYQNEKADRTYRVVLGHDIPRSSSSSSSTAGTDRDLCLYRNTSYTFSINLMTGEPPANVSETGTRSSDIQNGNGGIMVWPE